MSTDEKTLLPPSSALDATTDHALENRGRYLLTHLHAQGGIGRVWLARDEQLGRDVALKELRPERQDHATTRARFLEEARVTGQLEHPGIVPVHELVRGEDGSAFYTMRLIRGRTLGDAIKDYHRKRQTKEADPLDLRKLLSAVVAVCNAMAYAHSRGVVHRALKPANVVLGDYGEVMVLDWGLAKVVGQQEASALPVTLDASGRDETMQGQVLGTPSYMAPEQANGRIDLIGPATDVYGLGAILYQILTSRPPFDGGEMPTLLRRVVHEQPERPRLQTPAIPPALEAVCLKALAKSPSERYASAAELAKDVERWLADEPVTAWREPLRLRVGRWVRRHQSLVVSFVVAVLLLVVLLSAAGAWWSSERQRVRIATETALERIQSLQDQRKLDEARTILEQTRSRLESFSSANLTTRLAQTQANLDLLAHLDTIELEHAQFINRKGYFDFDTTDRKLAEAFADAGFDERLNPDQFAQGLTDIGLAQPILNSLDFWVGVARSKDRQVWLKETCRRLDPSPIRDRLLDPSVWRDQEKLARLVAEVDGKDLTPSLVMVLTSLLEKRPETHTLLRQAQEARPWDFWLNFTLANHLFDKKQYQEAEGHFRAALAQRPRVSVVNRRLSESLYHQGKHPAAERYARKALDYTPRDRILFEWLGFVLVAQNAYAEAEKCFWAAIELEPNNAYAYQSLGAIASKEGRDNDAIPLYRKAIEIDPRDVLSHTSLGRALAEKERFAESEQAYRKATKIDAQHANGYRGLGWALWQQQKPAEAETAYRRAVELDPKHALSYLALVGLLRQQRKWSDAARFAAAAFDADSRLADDLAAGHRYNAARSAVLASCGKGDAARPDEQRRLRNQALVWLKADLVLWSNRVHKGEADRAVVQSRLRHWQQNSDFDAVRGDQALLALPEDERKAWTGLWADVAKLARP